MPYSTDEHKILDLINSNIALVTSDPSAVANGWKSLSIDDLVITGTTAPTTSTIQSTAIQVKGASTMTVLYDVTGATTGVVISVMGGQSGFGFLTLRSVTASAGIFGFRLGSVTTGGTQDTTGVSRIDDLRVDVSLSSNTGAGTGVVTTVKTRILTQPSS